MFFGNRKKLKNKLKQQWAKPIERKREFELISRFHDNKSDGDYYQTISDQVRNDLNFEEVYKVVDRTSSRIGQQFLYHKLNCLENNRTKLKQFDKLVKHFQTNQESRLDTQQKLQHHSNKNASYICDFFQQEMLKKPEHQSLSYLSTLIIIFALITLPFAKFSPNLLLIFIPFNIFLHYKNKWKTAMFLQSFPYLHLLINSSKQLLDLPTTEAEQQNVKTSLAKLSRLKKYLNYFQLEAKVNSGNDLLMLFWAIREIFSSILSLDSILLFRTLDLIKEDSKEIETLFCYLGEIDSALSIASYRDGLEHYCHPEISEPVKQVIATELRHPLLPDCVPNDIDISNKGLLITGSNMSGKTTFLRSMALNVLFAQTIYTCLAKEFKLPPLKIYSTISLSDDIMQGKSLYMEEVQILQTLLSETDKPEQCLFILDELFKGTNTIERIAANKSVLSYLNRSSHIVLVSSHDIELIDYLKEEYDLYHFAESVIDDKIFFDHKIKPGPFTTRNAIKILEINNYPTEVIREAYKLSSEIGSLTYKK